MTRCHADWLLNILLLAPSNGSLFGVSFCVAVGSIKANQRGLVRDVTVIPVGGNVARDGVTLVLQASGRQSVAAIPASPLIRIHVYEVGEDH
jgi:hypothetical protein